jgi:hypothetical protein
MGLIDRFTRDRVSRYVWGALTLACLGVFLLARAGQDRALDQQVSAAFTRTETYAQNVFGQGLVEGRPSPVNGYTQRELYIRIRAEILTDPTAARVRLYDSDGTIVYDTDVLQTGQLVPRDNPQVDSALTGDTHGLVVENDPFTWSTTGSQGVPTSMLEVFTPLRLADRVGAEGVVEVDYLMDELRAAASGAWPTVQLIVAVLLLLCLAMFVLSLRPAAVGDAVPAARTKKAREPKAPKPAKKAPAPQPERPAARPAPSMDRPAPTTDRPAAAATAAAAATVAGAPRDDANVQELSAKIAELEQAVVQAGGSAAELETVRAREAALEQREAALEERLTQLEQRMQTPRAATPEPAPAAAPVEVRPAEPTRVAEAPDEPEPVAAPERGAEPVASSNGSAEPPSVGGLTEDEVNDLRARLAKAAARKKSGSS